MEPKVIILALRTAVLGPKVVILVIFGVILALRKRVPVFAILGHALRCVRDTLLALRTASLEPKVVILVLRTAILEPKVVLVVILFFVVLCFFWL